MNAHARLGARTVSRIGFGAMQLVPERTPDRSVPHERALAVLRRAVELGVTHIDTAQFYGGGRVNDLVREALAPYPEELVLATKVGAVRAGADLVPAQRPAELREQVEANLRALGVERLGLVNLRRVDSPSGIVAQGEQVVALDDQLAELVALRDEGLLESIGLSAVTGEQVQQAMPAGVACVQNLYNVRERDDDALLEWCAVNGVAWVPFFPLGSGFAGRPSPADDPAVRQVADESGASPRQVCLAWLLARDPHVLLIPGTSSVPHLEANWAAGDVALTGDQLARLDAVGR